MTTLPGLEVEVLPSEPSDPSIDPLSALPLPLRAAMEGKGYTTLTQVQEAVLAADGSIHDLRISSQTGSGKTVAIGIALAERLIAGAAEARRGPSVLLLAPTRELAEQVRSELEWLFALVPGVTTDCVTGGTSIVNERRRLKRAPRVLVATPGRLLDHLRSRSVDCTTVDQLVLDEADQMLDMGFREDLDAILAELSPERRTHMVSATFPAEVLEFVDRFQVSPFQVEGTALGAANADIEHVACVVPHRQRYDALVNLLLMGGGDRTLVFVRTRQDTSALAEQLAEDGFSAMSLSGDLAQAQRTRTLNAFRRGNVTTLVATDVAARGLDVPDVSQVIHFDLPIDSSIYTHRSGRTGRAGRKGRCVILVPPKAERRISGMLDQARVRASWRGVPPPEAVQRELDERAATEMAKRLEDAGEASDRDLDAARELLTSHDPVELIARLWKLARPAAPCEPRDLAPVAAPRRLPREVGPAARRGDRASGGFVRFAINWGSRDGASPKRVLAHVCRRGGISGGMVGAIEIAGTSSTFDVEATAASSFATRARTPDRRDPHLMIRAVESGRGSRERRRA